MVGLGAGNQFTKLYWNRFQHAAGITVKEERGDPLVTAEYLD